jgi:hypothetical protein
MCMLISYQDISNMNHQKVRLVVYTRHNGMYWQTNNQMDWSGESGIPTTLQVWSINTDVINKDNK